MKYTANATSAGIEVRKVLEVSPSGDGRLGYQLSSTRAAPATVTVVDRLDAVTTVLLPVTDGDRWTLSASTLEVQLSIDPERPVSTAVRFRTDDPDATAERTRAPQLDVVDSATIAAGASPTSAVSSDGGFEFLEGGADEEHASDRDGERGRRQIRSDWESEFSMPDDEYTAADLIEAVDVPGDE